MHRRIRQWASNLPPFVATARFISGAVLAGPAGSGVPGVLVQLSGAAMLNSLTGGSGQFLFTNLDSGNYTVTPLTNGNPTARFSPDQRCHRLWQPNQLEQLRQICNHQQSGGAPIEVNQAIQDWENSVPLVQAKRSIVRAHLQLPADVTNPVPVEGARLRGFRDGAELRTLSG